MTLKTLITLILCTLLCTACGKPDNPRSWAVTTKSIDNAYIDPDMRHVIVTTLSGQVEVWTLNQKAKPQYQWKTTPSKSVIQLGLRVKQGFAVAANDASIMVWNLRTGKRRASSTLSGPALSLATTLEGERMSLVNMRYAGPVVYSMPGARYIASVPYPQNEDVTAADLSEDGNLAAVATKKNNVYLWDLKTEKRKATLRHANKVLRVYLSKNGRYLLTNTNAGLSQIWFLREKRKPITLKTNGIFYSMKPAPLPIMVARFSNSGRYLATASPSGVIRIWRTKDGKLLENWQIAGGSGWKRSPINIFDLRFTPSERFLMTMASNGQAQVWKVR